MIIFSYNKQLSSMKQDIIDTIEEMNDKHLTIIKFNDEFMTKHELYDLLESCNNCNIHNVFMAPKHKLNNKRKVSKLDACTVIFKFSFQTFKEGENDTFFIQNLN